MPRRIYHKPVGIQMTDTLTQDRTAAVDEQIEKLLAEGRTQTFRQVEAATGIPYHTLKHAQRSDKITVEEKEVVIDDRLKEYVFGYKPRPAAVEEKAPPIAVPIVDDSMAVAGIIPDEKIREPSAEDLVRGILKLVNDQSAERTKLQREHDSVLKDVFRQLLSTTKKETGQVKRLKEILND